MSFNGSGTFVINSSGQPVVANTVISSTVFNALTADIATGLSTCITKDGQTTPTANIPMGTFKFTNLGNGSAATDSATLGQVQASTTKLVTVTGTDTITGTMTPALTAYASGQMFYFVAGGANTGAVTLNIDGLGARNVTRHGSVALVAGDILSGEVCVVVYDGTRFQLLNPASYTNLNVTGVLSLAAGTALLPSLAFSGDTNTGLWSPAADTLAASTGGSERLRLDSSGTLGIGVTPSAWSGGFRAMQLPGGSVASFASGTNLQIEVGNAYYQSSLGTYNYFNTGTAPTIYRQFSGSHNWYTAPSGTAGNAISFTQAMTLDASGALLVGNTTNYGVGSAENNSVQVKGPIVLAANNTGSANNRNWIFQTNAAAAGSFSLAYSSTNTGWPNAGYALVVDSSGNLGIGTASPGYKLDVRGTLGSGNGTITTGFSWDTRGLVGTFSNHGLGFLTNGAVVGTWDTSGNLGIGTASPVFANGSGIEIERAGAATLRLQDSSTTNSFELYVDSNVHVRGRDSMATIFYTSDTERMRITSDGNIVAGASAALATTATNGFLYVPTCAGTPTGTPTAITGMAPIVVNTTNNKLYFYSGGAWRDAGP